MLSHQKSEHTYHINSNDDKQKSKTFILFSFRLWQFCMFCFDIESFWNRNFVHFVFCLKLDKQYIKHFPLSNFTFSFYQYLVSFEHFLSFLIPKLCYQRTSMIVDIPSLWYDSWIRRKRENKMKFYDLKFVYSTSTL